MIIPISLSCPPSLDPNPNPRSRFRIWMLQVQLLPKMVSKACFSVAWVLASSPTVSKVWLSQLDLSILKSNCQSKSTYCVLSSLFSIDERGKISILLVTSTLNKLTTSADSAHCRLSAALVVKNGLLWCKLVKLLLSQARGCP